MIRLSFPAALTAAIFGVALPVSAAITATRHTDPVPSEIQAPVAALIQAGGVRASVDGKALDFWFVKGLPVTATAEWDKVAEGSLIGAVRIGATFRDIRGKVIKPGVYTLRYGIQPDNGDHLGVSPYRQFLLLSPARDDKNPAPQGHEESVELSKGSIGGSHPAVWSIDPPAAGPEAVLSQHKTDLGHESLIVEVPATRDGKPEGAMRFGIVLVGKIEA